MIYKFKSKATGDLLMTGPVGDRLLSLIGKEPASQGIIAASDMSAAIHALHAAVSAQDSQPQAVDTDRGNEVTDPGAELNVTLRQHAWPLIEMLKRAQAEGDAIVWGV